MMTNTFVFLMPMFIWHDVSLYINNCMEVLLKDNYIFFQEIVAAHKLHAEHFAHHIR